MRPRHFAWQAWHVATSTYVGRRGTWRHRPSFGVTGVVLGTIHAASESIALKYDFVTHNFVTHYLSHLSLSLTLILSCNFIAHSFFKHNSFTHNFVTHNFFTHHLSHTTLSHTIFHTLSHTIFHTQLCHTASFTHISSPSFCVAGVALMTLG